MQKRSGNSTAFAKVLFAVAVFLSAALLFSIQPLVAKRLLPEFGGAPAVWNTVLVFFQAALLVGYGWADFLAKRQLRFSGTHLLLFGLGWVVLSVGGLLSPFGASLSSEYRILVLLLTTLGPMACVLSASAPLIQSWYLRLSGGETPYFLYGWSNLGSFTGLLAYPLVIEGSFGLDEQLALWRGGAVVLLLILCLLFFLTNRHQGPAVEPLSHELVRSGSVERGRYLIWGFLAFVPASLLYGVTQHITTDLAAVPLLWVVPLGVYLLSFVVAFRLTPSSSAESGSAASNSAVSNSGLRGILCALLVVCVAGIPLLGTSLSLLEAVFAHLGCFGAIALLWHLELARRQPNPAELTRYYFVTAAGGVLAGVFNALIAPQLFSTVLEYPLTLLLAALLVCLTGISAKQSLSRRWILRLVPIVPLIVLVLSHRYSESRFGEVLFVERNFFGVKRVAEFKGNQVRALLHGTTNHGLQSVDPAKEFEPNSYYHRTGPLGDLFRVLQQQQTSLDVAILGLGIGGISAYLREKDRAVFYEIDPQVLEIASNQQWFTNLSRCGGSCEVVLGDGRLKFAEGSGRKFDLVLLDAFSSDSVPVHLLTKEAIRLYLTRVRSADSLIAINVTNRYLRFEAMLAAMAEELELKALIREDLEIEPALQAEGKARSRWVVFSASDTILNPLTELPGWRTLQRTKVRAWNDRYSSIVPLLSQR